MIAQISVSEIPNLIFESLVTRLMAVNLRYFVVLSSRCYAGDGMTKGLAILLCSFSSYLLNNYHFSAPRRAFKRVYGQVGSGDDSAIKAERGSYKSAIGWSKAGCRQGANISRFTHRMYQRLAISIIVTIPLICWGV